MSENQAIEDLAPPTVTVSEDPEAPEADALEQAAALTADSPGPGGSGDGPPLEANEADAAEQAYEVGGSADDDYR